MRLKLLGPVRILPPAEVRKEGNSGDIGIAARFRSRRTVALLGYLATEKRAISREQLALLFWPDSTAAEGRSNLRRELYNLAKLLPNCWKTDPQSVTFAPPDPASVDIYQLSLLEREGRWLDAAELLGGEFLEGLYLKENLEFETWLLGEQASWKSRSQLILGNACELLIGVAQYADAVHYGQRLVQYAPWNEEAQRKLMRLLVWTGRRDAALRQYVLCGQALEQELGVEPSEETQALFQQIQRGELDIPQAPPAYMQKNTVGPDRSLPLFVARDRELAYLNDRLDKALAGRNQIVFVTGGPGRGKTALMDAFSRQALANHPELLFAKGSCDAYAGVGDPYAPFRDVMSMLTGDVEARWAAGTIGGEHARRLWLALPQTVHALLEHGSRLIDVLLSGPSLLSRASAAQPSGADWVSRLEARVKRSQSESDSEHVSEQLTSFLLNLAEERPLLLFLDDIQWVDAASTGLLFHLGRRLAEVGGRILIVCAYRPAEITRDFVHGRHFLLKALSEFKRSFGDIWLSLSWADESEARRFVGDVIDSEPNRLGQSFRDALWKKTGGHPLFTLELLRAMQDRGDLVASENGVWREAVELDWQLLPARVEAVIEQRINLLGTDLQELLAMASVEGEIFTAQVLAQVQEVGEAWVLRRMTIDLDRRFGLVRELEEAQTTHGSIVRFRFSHVLFQAYLYGRLGPGERRRAHRAVAVALENLYTEELETKAVQLARHYDRAGDRDSAIRYLALAGDHAVTIYAKDEAIAHYSRAIALSSNAASEPLFMAEILRGRGVAYATSGDFKHAVADLEQALQNAKEARDSKLEWRLLVDLGKLYTSRDYDLTRFYFEQALFIARQLDEVAIVAASLNRMGNWYANNEEPEEALSLHGEAMRLLEREGDLRNLANTLDLLGIAYLLAGNSDVSMAQYNRAISLYRDLDNLSGLSSSLMGRAVLATAPAFLAVLPANEGSDPQADFREAVQLARRTGSFPDEAWSTWPLSLLHMIHGEFGQALQMSRRGRMLATNIGHREWIVGTQFTQGVLYLELLAPAKARTELDSGLELALELRSQYWINHMTAALAKTHMLLDELTLASNYLEQVVADDTPMNTTGRRYCWVRKAELALIQGDAASTLEIVDRLVASAAGMDAGRVIPFLWLLKGQALAALGQDENAMEMLRLAAESANENQERFLLWRIHAALGRQYRLAGQPVEAEREASRASRLVARLARGIHDDHLSRTFRRRALAEI